MRLCHDLQVQLFLLCFLLLSAQAFRLSITRTTNNRRSRNANIRLNANDGVNEKDLDSMSALIREGDFGAAFSLLKKEPLRQISFDDAVALCANTLSYFSISQIAIAANNLFLCSEPLRRIDFIE